MVSPFTRELNLKKKEQAGLAVSMAMSGQWAQAIKVNRAILKHSPGDLGAYNRLGKALSELGHNSKARRAFKKALGISPHNAIARKNLDRLSRMTDEAPAQGGNGGHEPSTSAGRTFIEESGRTGVTSLISLGPAETLLRLAPGKPVRLAPEGDALKAANTAGEYLGSVDPKLAARLQRLIRGGNRYEAAVTSVGGDELTIIIREMYKHPSQSGSVSFPNRLMADRRLQVQSSTAVGYEVLDRRDRLSLKDWTDDDTEPGDDDAFSPVVHRIINATGEDPSDYMPEDY